MIDLHIHSTKSDGTYTPVQLVDYAMEKSLTAFALTDHDSTNGIEEAENHAMRLRENLPDSEKHKVPIVIPGIELSTDENGTEVHVVGLYIDIRNQVFRRFLDEFIASRKLRNQKMCQKFQELGIDLTYEALLERFPDCVLTRAHYARFLKEKGVVGSNKEAFDRYLGSRCPCYVPREKITPQKAVQLILTAGGVPILAHPILYHLSDAQLEKMVADLKEAGLIGIEALYSSYTAADERQIRRLAQKYDLLISGGSDFHGDNKPGLNLGTGYGKLYIPDEILDPIARHAAILSSQK